MDARYLLTYTKPGRPHRQPVTVFGRFPFLAWMEATTKAVEHPEWVENVELFERRGDLWVKVDKLSSPEDDARPPERVAYPVVYLDGLEGKIEFIVAGAGPTRQAAVNVIGPSDLNIGSAHLNPEATTLLGSLLLGTDR